MIKAVLWDVDGTILNFLVAEAAAIRKLFAEFHLGTCTDEMLGQYSAINVRYWQMLERGEMTKPQILVGRFAEFFAANGLPADVAEAFNAAYQIRLGDTICFYDHAEQTLKALQGKVLQCAVTNGTKLAQTRKLAASGLNELFDYIFISEEVGAEKPAIAFFDRVFREIGSFHQNEVLIVGDSLTSDMRGGENAGIHTCWFNPYHKTKDVDVRVDAEIDDIAAVTDVMRRLADV